ncbi:hypothetical protein KZ483_04785 [Paenibacillus sp. sptzw28]|uniref:hypothetical protein n=1 Tax=Paenibacillus sp. sptzw28 TaxID=715179 RepID=UPI001C6E7151|nr:hypothetical protein [Paenibacillus sp. sptzw28]QYR22313.1 hypothetical protein KZ483_04785 [Paenibacillus sp. sptzw28]
MNIHETQLPLILLRGLSGAASYKYLSEIDNIDLLEITIQLFLFKTRWVINHTQELTDLCKNMWLVNVVILFMVAVNLPEEKTLGSTPANATNFFA